jgi:hypothetical protein
MVKNISEIIVLVLERSFLMIFEAYCKIRANTTLAVSSVRAYRKVRA